jgi:hypothetical protein
VEEVMPMGGHKSYCSYRRESEEDTRRMVEGGEGKWRVVEWWLFQWRQVRCGAQRIRSKAERSVKVKRRDLERV